MTDGVDEAELPAHVDSSVATTAALHTEHDRRATPVKRMVGRLVDYLGQPRFMGLMTIALVGWIAANIVLGPEALDRPPFPVLIEIATVLGLYFTVLILITQRHENELTEMREQLTLELAMLSEQKSAKIIMLLEEMRRDSPHLADRHDAEAAALSEAADAVTVLSAMQKHRDDTQPG